jgi:TP901 family phage tail tape measure protein
MPLNSRDLWLVLKAQDQTNRALNTFTRNVRNAGNQVRAAQLQAAQAASLGAISHAKLANELKRAEIGMLENQKATLKQAFTQAQLAGAQPAVLNGIRAQIGAIDQHTLRLKGEIAATNSVIANEKVHLQQIKESIAQNDAYNRSIQDQEKNLSHLAGRIQSVAQTATAAGFAFAAAGVVSIMALNKTVDTAVEYERQVRLTATQVQGFSGNLEELADIGRRVARDIAVPFKEVQPALYDIFSSIDVNVTEAEQLLTQFAKAAVAGQTDIQSVSRGTIGIMNAFGLGAKDLSRILDIQFKLVQKGIGTYDEWADRFGKVSPSAQRAGQSIEQMAAALAAATRFGVPAAQAATSVARVFDAFSNPKAITALKKLGVSVTDAKGNFRDFNVVMGEFRAALLKIPGGEADKIKVILDVFKGAGGTIEARKFLNTLLLSSDGLNTLNEILGEVSQSSGAMAGAYALMADSTAAKSQLLANQWELLKEGVGRALIPVFTKLVTNLSNLIKKFNELDPHTKKLIAMISLGAALFSTIAGVILVVVGIVGAFAAAITVAGTAIAVTLAVMGGLIVGAGLLVAAFVVLYKHSDTFRQMVSDLGGRLREVWDIAKGFAKDVGDAWDKYLSKPLGNLWNVINTKILPAIQEFAKMLADAFVPRMKEAARIIGDMVGPIFEFLGKIINNQIIPALKIAAIWWQEHKKQLQPVIDTLAVLAKILVIVGAIIVGVLAAALIGPVIAAFAAVIAIIAIVVNAFTTLLDIINWFVKTSLVYLKTWIDGAAKAFGWIPGIGPKLKEAAKDFDEFAARVNIALAEIKDRDVAVRVKVTATDVNGKRVSIGEGMTIPRVGGFAFGGVVKQSGMYMVGERGRELVMLAKGDRVYNNSESNQMLWGTHLPRSVGDGSGKQITQNITVNTQEIDPKSQAAKLGWELGKVL